MVGVVVQWEICGFFLNIIIGFCVGVGLESKDDFVACLVGMWGVGVSTFCTPIWFR